MSTLFYRTTLDSLIIVGIESIEGAATTRNYIYIVEHEQGTPTIKGVIIDHHDGTIYHTTYSKAWDCIYTRIGLRLSKVEEDERFVNSIRENPNE